MMRGFHAICRQGIAGGGQTGGPGNASRLIKLLGIGERSRVSETEDFVLREATTATSCLMNAILLTVWLLDPPV